MHEWYQLEKRRVKSKLVSSTYLLKTNQLEAASGILILLFPALLMTVPDGGAVVLLLLVLLSLIGLARNKYKIPLNQQEIWLFVAIGFYLAINLFNVWYFDTRLSGVDNVNRFLLLLPVYFYIRKTKLSYRPVIFGIAIGAAACFVIAVYQKIFLGVPRAHGLQNAVPFGGLSITLGLMCLAIGQTMENRRKKIWMYCGFLLACTASILSGTRGAWLALPVGLITLLILNPRNWSAKSIVISVLITLPLVVLTYAIPIIQIRVDTTMLNLVAYYTGADTSTSIGLRLETWRAAIIAFTENPVLGIGEGNFHSTLRELAKTGEIDPLLATSIAHVHNEFFSVMLHRGIPGLMSTLLLFLLPLATFCTQFKQQQGERKVLLAMGIMLIISSMTTALSDVFFGHHKQTLFYAMYIYLVYGLAFTDNLEVDTKCN